MKKFFGKIWSGWKKIALVIARVNAEIILFIFYFLIFTPYGLILKLFGHDPLRLRTRNLREWIRYEPQEFDLEKLKRQS